MKGFKVLGIYAMQDIHENHKYVSVPSCTISSKQSKGELLQAESGLLPSRLFREVIYSTLFWADATKAIGFPLMAAFNLTRSSRHTCWTYRQYSRQLSHTKRDAHILEKSSLKWFSKNLSSAMDNPHIGTTPISIKWRNRIVACPFYAAHRHSLSLFICFLLLHFTRV